MPSFEVKRWVPIAASGSAYNAMGQDIAGEGGVRKGPVHLATVVIHHLPRWMTGSYEQLGRWRAVWGGWIGLVDEFVDD